MVPLSDDLSLPKPGPEPPAAAAASGPRRWRFTLGTAMVAVVMAAAASALFAKLHRLLAPVATVTSDTPLGIAIDLPLVTLLAVGATGIVVGCLRRRGPNATMLAIAATCGLGLLLIWVVESHKAYVIYLFEALFALLALPLLARRAAARMREGRWVSGMIALLDLLIDCFLITACALVGTGINFFLFEIATS